MNYISNTKPFLTNTPHSGPAQPGCHYLHKLTVFNLFFNWLLICL